MPRTLFLDIDGVVATSASYRTVPQSVVNGKWTWPEPWRLLVPQLVGNVQTLCATADAGVVISSSWRAMHPLEDIISWLRSAGLEAPIIGQTETLELPRGLEIQAWVEAHNLQPVDIVILEDEEDVRPYRSRQVRTCSNGPRQGFTERHLRGALRLWNLKP